MTGVREGSVVEIRGERGLWRVAYIGVALGEHYQEAHCKREGESMGKPTRRVPLVDCSPAPADLEDFPTAPV